MRTTIYGSAITEFKGRNFSTTHRRQCKCLAPGIGPIQQQFLDDTFQIYYINRDWVCAECGIPWEEDKITFKTGGSK